MTDEKLEEEKRQLHKLLREYNANSGMAGFVCSIPVALMPEQEQKRLIDGFATPDNLRVLELSRKKLSQAQQLPLSESESEKIERALPVLAGLHAAFTGYVRSEIDRDTLRERVRSLVQRPVPETQDQLIDILSHQVETLLFLSSQSVGEKDSWDSMVDCVQLYEALARTRTVCQRLSKLLPQLEAVRKTAVCTDDVVSSLESFFKGHLGSDILPELFRRVEAEMQALWTEDEQVGSS